MKKTVIISLLLFALGLFALAQFGPATCPYDGAQASPTGSTRTNRNAAPALECQYSHQYWDKDHWAGHTFWQPCGS